MVDTRHTKLTRRDVLVSTVGTVSSTLGLALEGCAAAPAEPPSRTALARPPASAPEASAASEPAPAAESASAAVPESPPAEPEHAPEPPAPFAPEHFNVVARVGRNHGHVFSVELSEVAAGADRDYDLRGTSDHAHRVNISAEEFRALQRGETLRKQSERGGSNAHRHRLLLRLDPHPLPPERINACWIQIGGKDDHELVIPESHVRGGRDQTYDIQGVAPHTHAFTLTAQHFEALLAGKQLDLETGRGLGHFHHVYLRYPLR